MEYSVFDKYKQFSYTQYKNFNPLRTCVFLTLNDNCNKSNWINSLKEFRENYDYQMEYITAFFTCVRDCHFE